MAKETVHEAALWLPSEFVYDDLVLVAEQEALQCSSKSGSVSAGGLTSNPETPVTESGEEDYMAGLTQRMAHSFLLDDDEQSWAFAAAGDAKVGDMAGSPQSTLYDWPSSKKGSPDGASLVSSPPLSPGEEGQQKQQLQQKEDPWALLSEAAGQVMRLRLNDPEHGRDLCRSGLLGGLGKSSTALPAPCNKAGTGYYGPSPTLEQLRAAQFYRLKQLQMMKQHQQQKKQINPWGTYVKPRGGGVGGGGGGGVYGEGRCEQPLDLSPSAWPPLRKKPGSGEAMRAVFLNRPTTRKDSVGTGVFIPRHADNIIDPPPRKRPACSTVLVPARVVQALNLNLDELGAQPRFHGAYALDQAALVGRSMSHQKRYHLCPQPAAAMTAAAVPHELRLPQEWTY